MDRYQKFTATRAKYKRDLLGSVFSSKTPVIAIDFSSAENAEEYADLEQGLKSLGAAVFAISGSKPEFSEKVRRAADIIIAFDSNAAEIRAYGCVPVCRLDGNGTNEYDPLAEKGDGFYFKNPIKWEIFAAVVRAMETYKFPYDWGNLVKEVIKK